MTENKRYYVDKDGDLYDGKTNELLMLDFGYDKYTYVKNIIDRLNEQDTEIKRLKVQLQTDEEDVCIKCKHHYLINYPESSKYYISKCKKGHEECSKEYIRFCEDFELKEENIE